VASITLVMVIASFAATVSTRSVTRGSKSRVSETPRVQKRMTSLKRTRRSATRSRTAARSASRARRRRVSSRRHRRYYERFYTSSFAEGQADGDVTAGEDPVVRAAAIEALGNMNGTVVAIDPQSGRVLAMVNQNLALSSGAQPCSTFKVAVGLAALNENLITKETKVALGRRYSMDLTQALAHSNNAYFEAVGRQLGFAKVSYYAHQFGMGELAGYNIEGEQLGRFPSTELAAKLGGVGKMCSFGESISMTPLQLGALVGAIANGGTLYYLQHPQTPEEVANFQPRVKRYLEIGKLIPEVNQGMLAATQYGTARSVRYNFSEEEVMGKTGTCSKDGTRLGWFASYANTQYGRIVTVVFLRGGRPTFGPKAAEIAGRMYRNLYDHSYFAARVPVTQSMSNQAPVGVSH
jgi:penicillin-binding protein 2